MPVSVEKKSEPVYGALYLELAEKKSTGRHRPPVGFTVSLDLNNDFYLLSSNGITTGILETDVPNILDLLNKTYRVIRSTFTPGIGKGRRSIDYKEEFALDFLTTLSLPQAEVFLENETRPSLLEYKESMGNGH